ncbi:hypothetical protein AtNW77_Chr4g0291991 [Arabidopsis thaliana]
MIMKDPSPHLYLMLVLLSLLSSAYKYSPSLFSSLTPINNISNFLCPALVSSPCIQTQHIYTSISRTRRRIREVMSCSLRSGLVIVFCFILLLLSSNVGCASAARRLRSHKHHHHKVASLDVFNGGERRRALGGVETGEEVVVMDYPQPHRKPPIHNEKS